MSNRLPDPHSSETITRRTAAERRLQVALRLFGSLDLLAAGGVVMPRYWMQTVHQSLGQGTLPDAAIVGYLARTTSLLYALHGVLILIVASDIVRYAPLVRSLAMIAIIQGCVLIGIDLAERLPLWWVATEGSCLIAIGLIVLALDTARRRTIGGDAREAAAMPLLQDSRQS